MKKKLNNITLTILFSFRNEKENFEKIFQEVSKLKIIKKKLVELLFISDQSDDGSIEELLRLKKIYSYLNIRIFNTNVHLGNTRCIMLGYKLSSGKCTVYIDSDLQDPINIIDELYDAWLQGFKVVQTRRNSRKGESQFKLLLTNVAYWTISKLNKNKLTSQVGEFKLIDREILNFVTSSNNLNPYLRGLTSIFKFNTKTINYDRLQRNTGTTHYSLLNSLNPYTEFIKGLIFNNESLPIRLFILESTILMSASLLYFVNKNIVLNILFFISILFIKINAIIVAYLLISNKSDKYLNFDNIDYLIKEI